MATLVRVVIICTILLFYLITHLGLVVRAAIPHFDRSPSGGRFFVSIQKYLFLDTTKIHNIFKLNVVDFLFIKAI